MNTYLLKGRGDVLKHPWHKGDFDADEWFEYIDILDGHIYERYELDLMYQTREFAEKHFQDGLEQKYRQRAIAEEELASGADNTDIRYEDIGTRRGRA